MKDTNHIFVTANGSLTLCPRHKDTVLDLSAGWGASGASHAAARRQASAEWGTKTGYSSGTWEATAVWGTKSANSSTILRQTSAAWPQDLFGPAEREFELAAYNAMQFAVQSDASAPEWSL